MLVRANIINFEIFQLLAICMSASMCIDLYLSFLSPFYPAHRRMKYYLIGTVVVTILMGFYQYPWLPDPPSLYNEYFLDFLYLNADVQ